MSIVNRNLETILIVAFYKKTLSAICSGSSSTVLTSNMSLSGHVSQFCVGKYGAGNTSFPPRNDSMTGLLPPIERIRQ